MEKNYIFAEMSEYFYIYLTKNAAHRETSINKQTRMWLSQKGTWKWDI